LYVIYLIYLDVDYLLYITGNIHQQIWGYKVEDKLHLGVLEHGRLNTAVVEGLL
jgi:hypothetical protein